VITRYLRAIYALSPCHYLVFAFTRGFYARAYIYARARGAEASSLSFAIA
jgi:hypothetical protein